MHSDTIIRIWRDGAARNLLWPLNQASRRLSSSPDLDARSFRGLGAKRDLLPQISFPIAPYEKSVRGVGELAELAGDEVRGLLADVDGVVADPLEAA